MKTKIKLLIKSILWIAVIGGFAAFMFYLNTASNTAEVEEKAWEADAYTKESEGWKNVAENDRLSLYFDPAKVQLMVEDKEHNTKWYSNPVNAETDSIAFGQNKSAIQSLLNITYVDEQGSSYTVNSKMGSVQKNTYSYEYQNNGVFVNFQFEEQGFEVPCFFGLQNDRFVARIISEDIKQHGALQISKISFLQFFGAGGLEDEGYMVVPDGSGAVINYNNQKQNYQSYSQSVYGRNLAVNLTSFLLDEQAATMPVFGAKKNDDAFLAVITAGEYQAEIRADVSRKMTESNSVYSLVNYIQAENNTLMAGSNDEEKTTMLSPQDINFPYYEVSYFFLGKDAGYAEMAKRYRDYLIEEMAMTATDKEQKAVNLSFIGGVKVQKTFMGVPYFSDEALSSFKQIGEVANNITSEKSNSFIVSVQYSTKDTTECKLPVKASFENKLGGKKGYLRLQNDLNKNDVDIYQIYDPVKMRKSGNGYTKLSAIRNVTRSEAIQYDYKLTTGLKDTNKPHYDIITSPKVPEIISKLMKSVSKSQIQGIGFSSLANSVYADYRKNNISMNETGAYLEESLTKIDEASDNCLLDGAYSYGFAFADVISRVPVYSSQYDIEDYDIPFYEMVVRGYATLYGEPVNYSGNISDYLLRMTAYGVSPTFEVMCAEQEAVKDTDYQKYFSSSYSNWKQEIYEVLEKYTDLAALSNKEITDYKRINNFVSVTTYENDTKVYVNYSAEDQNVDGLLVKAKSFVVKEKR